MYQRQRQQQQQSQTISLSSIGLFNRLIPMTMWIGLMLHLLLLPLGCHGWVQQNQCHRRQRHHNHYYLIPPIHSSLTRTTITTTGQHHLVSLASAPTTADSSIVNSKDDNNDGDDDEYDYVEYEILTENEFRGSEWLVGTVFDSNPNKIQETWVRMAVDRDGKNVAIWGDNSQGTWSLDVANQFLSISKESLIGKDIWAGVVDDYYYARGTVRGWNFFSAASVVGQWQAKRLGVDKDEAGIAPWFEEEEKDDGDSTAGDASDAVKA